MNEVEAVISGDDLKDNLLNIRKRNYSMIAHLQGKDARHLAKFVDALSSHGYKLRRSQRSPFVDGYHAEACRGRHVVGLTNTEDKTHGSDWVHVLPHKTHERK